MATKEFTTYMDERSQDFIPNGLTDFGITRKPDGSVRKVRLWRFGAQSTIGDPVPDDGNLINLKELEEADGSILPTESTSDIFIIAIEEGDVRWIKFNNGGSRIIGNEFLIVPGGVIIIEAGDMIQVVGLADDVAQVLQTAKGTGIGTVEGVSPVGWVQLDTNPVDGETKDIGGVTLTFKNSPVGFPDVQIGSDAEDTTANLVAILNAQVDDAILSKATYTAYDSKTIIIYEPGTDGNTFDLTGGTADFSTSGATLEGGQKGIEQKKAGMSLVSFVSLQIAYSFQADLTTSPATGLEVEIETPGRYSLSLFVRSKAVNSALKFDFAGTANIDNLSGGGFPVQWRVSSSSGAVQKIQSWTDSTSSPDFSAFDTLDNTIYEVYGSVLFTTAGTFRLRAAMIVSEAGNTTIRVGSFMELRPLF